jgi:glycosyltransferase involved in cell wall biosynthesis
MASRDNTPDVARCLDSIARQTLQGSVEVIVADCSTDGTDRIISSNYPAATVLHVAQTASQPDLLGRALLQAQGGVVAVTDVHCVFPSNWAEKLLSAHELDYGVIGGAVEYGGPHTMVGWTCYFADYGAFMLPSERRETPLLSGNHVSYKRGVIQGSPNSLRHGYWKVFFHEDLVRKGTRFLFEPALAVSWTPAHTFWEFARRYYRDARDFAALRCQRISLTTRLLRAITAPALLPLLLYRRLAAVWPRRKRRATLILSAPLLAILIVAWSAGELAGYISGCKISAGNSCSKQR